MKKLDNERGAALITALMMLTILMLLGFASLILSNIDIKIAGNERSSMASQYAAEAGLAAATVFLNSTSGKLELTAPGPTGAGIPSTSDPTYGYQPSNHSWTQTLSGNIAGTGYNYTATISFKNNSTSSGVPLTDPGDITHYPVYTFDTGFGYKDCPPNKGYPVLIMDVTAYGPNNSNCKIEEQVTKYVIPIGNAIKGAITANSGITLTGHMTVSGLTYDENGNPVSGSGETPLPGIDSQGTSTIQGSATSEGSTGTFTNTTTLPDPTTTNFIGDLPQAFGLSDTSLYYDSNFGWITPDLYAILSTAKVYQGGQVPTSGDLASGGIFYIQENYGDQGYGGSQLSGNGLLLVHNPNYVPDAWRVSCPTDPTTGQPNPNYKLSSLMSYYDGRLDSSNSLYTSDPSWHTNDFNGNPPGAAPENLGNITGGNFKGVIIADNINKIAGNVNIYGDIISLGTLIANVNQFGAGTGSILYSPDAISKYVTGKASINKRLSWEKKTAY